MSNDSLTFFDNSKSIAEKIKKTKKDEMVDYANRSCVVQCKRLGGEPVECERLCASTKQKVETISAVGASKDTTAAPAPVDTKKEGFCMYNGGKATLANLIALVAFISLCLALYYYWKSSSQTNMEEMY